MSGLKDRDLQLCRRLIFQARPYRKHLLCLFLLSLLSTPFVLLAPLPLKIAVDSIVHPAPLPPVLEPFVPSAVSHSKIRLLFLAAALVVAVTLLKQLHGLGTNLLQTYTGEKLALGFRAQLLSHLHRLSLSYHDRNGTVDSLYRLQNDAPAVQAVLVKGLIPLVSAVVTLAGMLYVTARIDLQLAALAFGVSPAIFLLVRSSRRRLRTSWHEVKKLESAAMAAVQESLLGIRLVKAFAQEKRTQEQFATYARKGARGHLRVSFIQGSFDLLIALVIALGTAAVLFVGVRHVLLGTLTLGSLLLVMGYLAQLYAPLETVSKQAGNLQSSLASAERAFALFDELPEVGERPDAKPLKRARGSVQFKNVSFLPRFYDPTDGQILLDGMDLRDYKLGDLRNQFAVVLQEPVLFSTTIAENISYGQPGATQEEIVAAARAGNAHDFIVRLPQGYDTPAGERGMLLSGGERQRIALARAFLKDAPILILDEPTSSIDLNSERLVLEAMERLKQNRTTFLITHRLSTLEKCDLLLVIEQGRLVDTTPDLWSAIRNFQTAQEAR